MAVKLGSVYRDKVTGFEGVAVGRYEYLNGCVRYALQPRELREGKPIEAQTFDVEQLEATDAQGVEMSSRRTGGPESDPKPRHEPKR